jgi:hypothetical protein
MKTALFKAKSRTSIGDLPARDLRGVASAGKELTARLNNRFGAPVSAFSRFHHKAKP